MRASEGFASSSDQRLHFGLGNAAGVELVEIHWPSGLKEHVVLPGIDAYFTIVEGKGKPVTKMATNR